MPLVRGIVKRRTASAEIAVDIRLRLAEGPGSLEAAMAHRNVQRRHAIRHGRVYLGAGDPAKEADDVSMALLSSDMNRTVAGAACLFEVGTSLMQATQRLNVSSLGGGICRCVAPLRGLIGVSSRVQQQPNHVDAPVINRGVKGPPARFRNVRIGASLAEQPHDVEAVASHRLIHRCLAASIDMVDVDRVPENGLDRIRITCKSCVDEVPSPRRIRSEQDQGDLGAGRK
mmetsp:Transcript_51216/g.147842  ORF Transcript_51216/g.147842 Transcript_51216/m.147842 type:complete len:229 (-) Transcript_51216:320-1006(-)